MTKLVKFYLDNGSSFIAEVDTPVQTAQTMRGGSPNERLMEAVNNTFEDAVDSVKHAAEAIMDRLCALSRPPDDLTLELGIKLSAEAGAIIAKTSTEANVKITISWRRPSSPVE